MTLIDIMLLVFLHVVDQYTTTHFGCYQGFVKNSHLKIKLFYFLFKASLNPTPDLGDIQVGPKQQRHPEIVNLRVQEIGNL